MCKKKQVHEKDKMKTYYYEGRMRSEEWLANTLKSVTRIARIKHTVRMIPCGCFSILDVGCGIGYLPNELAKKSTMVTGIDMLDTNIEIARAIKEQQNIWFKQGNADKLDELGFEKESFDAITATEILEHLEKPAQFLKNCHELLKKDGILVISTPNSVSPTNILINYIKSNRDVQNEKKIFGVECDHLSEWSIRTLTRLMNHCGFKVLKFKYTKYSIVLKAKKS